MHTNLPQGETGAPRSERLAEDSVTLDSDRQDRCGYPEAVYGEGKSAEAIRAILEAQQARGQASLVTRIDATIAEQLLAAFPDAHWNRTGRTFTLASASTIDSSNTGQVAVITAGTTDLPVAEEAAETLAWMGLVVTRVTDVGVAGPHRLPERLDEFRNADAIVVVAGMEGALPSVVAGHVPCPVIAVPTSVGYGANLGGVAALLSMINSCAANVAVVNIDAGFKAGYIAGLIAARAAKDSS